MAQPGRLAILIALVALILALAPGAAGLVSKAAGIDPGVAGNVGTGRPAGVSVSPTPTSAQSLRPTPTSYLPSITYFTCDPCILEPGGATTLRWDLSGATAAYLDGEGVTAPGSTVVYPDQTTTFRLVAVSEDGQSEETVTVEVRGLPAIHYLTCLPCDVLKGEQSTLSWDLGGATAAYLDGQGVTAPGSTVVAPDQTTTYRLVAVGERGSVERLVTVTVNESSDPDTISEQLRRSSYDVRWVGYLPLAEGGDTIGVVMGAITDDLHSQELASQYFEGLKVLFDGFPGEVMTVGLYDGRRYMLFATVESGEFETLLRGEIDGTGFWQMVTWNLWDEWTGRWLEAKRLNLGHKDFVTKNFGL